MYAWNLPVSIELSGKLYRIRTDYRIILDILAAMNDPEIYDGMTEEEKGQERAFTILQILYVDFNSIPPRDYDEALRKACDFIDCGMKESGKPQPRSMDWEQDAPVIVPAVNKVFGQDVRGVKYMHWWTFFGLYMEIGESTFAQIVSIRQKKAKGKKLEKWEQEYYRENKHLIDLECKKVKRSEAEQDELRKLFGLRNNRL